MVLNGKKNIHKFDEDFTTNCDEYSNKGCDLEVDFECPKILLNLHSDLPFLSERIKIKKSNKLVCNMSSTHLGFSEGRGSNFRKGANQYKRKKKQI